MGVHIKRGLLEEARQQGEEAVAASVDDTASGGDDGIHHGVQIDLKFREDGVGSIGRPPRHDRRGQRERHQLCRGHSEVVVPKVHAGLADAVAERRHRLGRRRMSRTLHLSDVCTTTSTQTHTRVQSSQW